MRLSFSKLSLLRNRPAVTLDAALRLAWRIVILVLLFLVLADGFMFYQYGLGYAYFRVAGGGDAIIKVREKAVRDAVEIIKNRREEFEAAGPAQSDLPNPFR